jgi:DNA ligase 1
MREFLMLAKSFDSQIIIGWYCSEKLDGMRAFWDGGISQGVLTDLIPWTTQRGMLATGLWSRYGKVIHAPEWFTEQLPRTRCLDGELWAGYNRFQDVMSICKQYHPDNRWHEVRYMVFDSPSHDQVFTTGAINNPNFQLTIQNSICRSFIENLDFEFKIGAPSFEQTYQELEQNLLNTLNLELVKQNRIWDLGGIEEKLKEVVEKGGEGVILRNPRMPWVPNRTKNLLKYKPYMDAEATVIGYYWGAGKYQNMLGSLLVGWNGLEFELSGFTDVEREMPQELEMIPGHYSHTCSLVFPRGSKVTFRYRGLTELGIPREARYWRKYHA